MQALTRGHKDKHGVRAGRRRAEERVSGTCVDWITVRSLIRLNPAPMGALSPAVPKLIRLHSLVLSWSR